MTRLGVLAAFLFATPCLAQSQTYLWSEDGMVAVPRPPVQREALTTPAQAPAPTATATPTPTPRAEVARDDLQQQFVEFLAWREFEAFLRDTGAVPAQSAAMTGAAR